MYRKLQQQAKEYIISILSELSDEWWFNIEFGNGTDPIIKGYGPKNLIMGDFWWELRKYLTKEVENSLWSQYEMSGYDLTKWIRFSLISQLVPNIFEIYGIIMEQLFKQSATIYILKKDRTKRITSYICSCSNNNQERFISPFTDWEIKKHNLREKFASPLLLLLDPIAYFELYSIIIKKYPELSDNHTLGVHELLLEYFPEMNKKLFVRYWALHCVFQNECVDMVGVIGGILVELYV